MKNILHVVLALLTALTASAHIPRASLELRPGAHPSTAEAKHSSGLFTTNASVWFTNNVARHTTTDSFDHGGYLTNRIWKNPDGTTNRIQNLTWDARGRLLKMSELDLATNGLSWSAVYDAFNRRALTTSFVVTNGLGLSNQPTSILQYYDPEVEFLEVGVAVNGRATWKIHGPDLNGVYGGLNGLGGFDAIIPGPELFCPVLTDARGNVLSVYDQTHGTLTWNESRPTGYGAVPAYRPPPLGHGGDLVQSSAWRGRWLDVIGSYQIGLRPYLSESGSWGSPDSLGHDGSDSLFSFADGDSINRWDADGRAGIFQSMFPATAIAAGARPMSGSVAGDLRFAHQYVYPPQRIALAGGYATMGTMMAGPAMVQGGAAAASYASATASSIASAYVPTITTGKALTYMGAGAVANATASGTIAYFTDQPVVSAAIGGGVSGAFTGVGAGTLISSGRTFLQAAPALFTIGAGGAVMGDTTTQVMQGGWENVSTSQQLFAGGIGGTASIFQGGATFLSGSLAQSANVIDRALANKTTEALFAGASDDTVMGVFSSLNAARNNALGASFGVGALGQYGTPFAESGANAFWQAAASSTVLSKH